jgi:hypothetical protein
MPAGHTEAMGAMARAAKNSWRNQRVSAQKSEKWRSILPNSGMPLWLNNAMEDALNYKETYLELADAAVFLNRHAGWFRFASRLEDHRAEVLIAHREYSRGAHVLSNNVGACTQDQWTQAHY